MALRSPIVAEEGTAERCVSCVVVGAGNRGHGYALFALEQPQRMRVSAVAEPRPFRRRRICEEHGIASGHALADWRELLELENVADFAIVSTQDRDHVVSRMPACSTSAGSEQTDG